MAAIIMVRPGQDWQSTGGLFDWTLGYLIAGLRDRAAADELQTVLDNHLDALWIPDLPSSVQQELYGLLRNGLLEAAEQELPDGRAKASAVDHLRSLAALTGQKQSEPSESRIGGVCCR